MKKTLPALIHFLHKGAGLGVFATQHIPEGRAIVSLCRHHHFLNPTAGTIVTFYGGELKNLTESCATFGSDFAAAASFAAYSPRHTIDAGMSQPDDSSPALWLIDSAQFQDSISFLTAPISPRKTAPLISAGP